MRRRRRRRPTCSSSPKNGVPTRHASSAVRSCRWHGGGRTHAMCCGQRDVARRACRERTVGRRVRRPPRAVAVRAPRNVGRAPPASRRAPSTGDGAVHGDGPPWVVGERVRPQGRRFEHATSSDRRRPLARRPRVDPCTRSSRERGELHRLVALDAVAGTLEHLDPRVGTAAPQLLDVLVVDDGRQCAPRERQRHLDRARSRPTACRCPGSIAAVVAFAAAAPREVVAPAPPTVGSSTALCRTPRRNDDSDRVGLNAMVRSRISSKVSKYSGPSMNCTMVDAFSWFTPGRHVDEAERRHEIGRASGERDRVRPPSDMPTTSRSCGASSRTAASTATAFSAGQYAWSSRWTE